MAALIYQFSEGNPLFMVAAVDHLRNRGLIAVENGTWQLMVPLESIHLEAPENLRQMIELQIGRLSAEEQRVLEIASVAGLSFTANLNALGTTIDRETFESVCEDLSRRHLMVRRTVSNQFSGGMLSECYEFAHALYRDVFYRRQSPARRAKLQLRIGARAAQSLSLIA